jgi:selenocysteine-specific elongation factor
VLHEDAALVTDAGRVVQAGEADAGLEHVGDAEPWVSALEASLFAPPPPEMVDGQLLRELVKRKVVVARDGIYFAPTAVKRASEVVAVLLARQPGGVTASEIREALGTTRKYLLPLLAELDATGVTRRRGDLRVAGPRLPTRQPASEEPRRPE